MVNVQAARTAGVKAGLTRGAVLEAALALVDAEGIERLSMRRLAATLDVEAQSIYNHIANKQDLIDGVVEIVLAPAIGISVEVSWGERLTEHLRGIRQQFVEHPRAYDLVLQASTRSVAIGRTTTQLLAILEEAGLEGWQQRQAFTMITSALDGFVIGERFRSRMGAIPDDLPEEFAELPAFFGALEQDGATAHFEAVITRLRDAVADMNVGRASPLMKS
ncbi:TetR/AcrR family transcriptional regulator [Tsukamurella ocularis]|uniref:TetR/AcrR family transcriptional regulator n=1 Tax=Tsukamurella ocularis TaxID=1970234 RepID=UPI0039F14424